YEDIFGEPLETAFLERLAFARSNIPEHKDGRVVYEKFVKPTMINWQKVATHYALKSLFNASTDRERIYCYSVDIKDLITEHNGHTRLTVGNAQITSEITLESKILSFGAIYLDEHTINAGVGVYQTENSYSALKQKLGDAFGRTDFPDVIQILDRHF